jgi:hypothetical protein
MLLLLLSRICVYVMFFHENYIEFVDKIISVEINNLQNPTIGYLLYQRYINNANSLLTLRCALCHSTIILRFMWSQITEDYLKPQEVIAHRSLVIDELLEPFPDIKVQNSILGTINEYRMCRITTDSFISTLSSIWLINSADCNDINIMNDYKEKMTNGILVTGFCNFIQHCILVIPDLERRTAAQLALYRSYPKMYTWCCHGEHCFMCKVSGHHEDQTCEEVQSAMNGENVQFCAGCNVPTIRTEGCTHIECVCGASWTWIENGDDQNDENSY